MNRPRLRSAGPWGRRSERTVRHCVAQSVTAFITRPVIARGVTRAYAEAFRGFRLPDVPQLGYLDRA
jgi:hypothetical protein